MLTGWVILFVSFAYLCLLFGIAYYGDKRAGEGRSLLRIPHVYALSIAVYCTSWTFYGSVGRAASHGFDFLAIYLGPTLTFVLWWFVLKKIIRIAKANRITSIADFISSRYGKSPVLSGLVTVIAVVGIMPYISLQLKAVSTSFKVILGDSGIVVPNEALAVPFFVDTSFMVALAMAAFSILFGTRQIDTSEHHEGMVVAIAFESIVKLFAFLAVGIFVTFGLYDGFGDLFTKAAESPERLKLLTVAPDGNYNQWMTLTVLSMTAIICLPRQFQVTVIENVDERHLNTAAWLFPLYLLLINIFVFPIAMSGLMMFAPGTVDADTFVLTIPMSANQEILTLLVFIGGLSAATAMVIVATIALSTMVCNDLVMPLLLRLNWLRLERGDLSHLLLVIRRSSIVLIVLLSYIYFRSIGESYTLVTIGLVSFAAAAQFAPAIIGGVFWKGGTWAGALSGLSLGFAVWVYTLLLPSFARSGWLPVSFMSEGPFGIELLRPYALFGVEGLDTLSHALFWSLLFNVGGYIALSLLTRPSALERVQAALFVDVFRSTGDHSGSRFWRGTATVTDLRELAVRFVGQSRADRAFADYARSNDLNLDKLREADADLVSYTEQLLAGVIGAASAQVMVSSVAKGEIVGIDEVMRILDETSHVIEYSHQLEQKSKELEFATTELRSANARLKELDQLKDNFLTTVSHEIRTPLTSIRSFAEILFDSPELDLQRREEFLGIIVKESERLTRLINQILDLEKMDAGQLEWRMTEVDPGPVIVDSVEAARGLFGSRAIQLSVSLPDRLPTMHADRDRLYQVIFNLLSNAVDFCNPEAGAIEIVAESRSGEFWLSIQDDGPGVPSEAREIIFEKFHRLSGNVGDNADRSGLGLSICRRIVTEFGGKIWVESGSNGGARFCITVPAALRPESIKSDDSAVKARR